MATLGNEYTLVENPALDYLINKLGYAYIEGEKLAPSCGERESFRDVIFVKRFRSSIKKLNPWMDEVSIETTVKFLLNSENLGTSLLEINEKIHKAIVDLNFTVVQTIDGQKKWSVLIKIDMKKLFFSTFF